MKGIIKYIPIMTYKYHSIPPISDGYVIGMSAILTSISLNDSIPNKLGNIEYTPPKKQEDIKFYLIS